MTKAPSVSTTAQCGAGEALPAWEDPRVQIVYEALCDQSLHEPPNREEHWEGWLARNIVARLSVSAGGKPVAWRSVDWGDRIVVTTDPAEAKRWEEVLHRVVEPLGPIGFAAIPPSNPPGAEPSQDQVDSACMSYRHDFGLMIGEERLQIQAEARQWLIAWQKEGIAANPPGDVREKVIEECIRVAAGVLQMAPETAGGPLFDALRALASKDAAGAAVTRPHYKSPSSAPGGSND